MEKASYEECRFEVGQDVIVTSPGDCDLETEVG